MNDRWLRFGAFQLDTETGDLLGPDGPVRLQPLPARVLVILASQAGLVVSRVEIRERVWGERTVAADQALNTAIRQVRRALHDSATEPRFIATVPRRGYRFMATVASGTGPTSNPTSILARHRRAGRQPRRTLLAVMAVAAALVVLAVAVAEWTAGDGGSSVPAASGSLDDLPPDRRLEYLKARELLDGGDASAWRRAAEALDLVRARRPDFLAATSGAALAALRLGESERAAGLAAWTLVADSGNAEAHVVLGTTLLQRGEWGPAGAALARARALSPDLVLSYTGLAVLEALDGRLDSALALASAAVDIEPVTAFTLADAGYVALWADRPALALEWCGHGRDMRPRDPALEYCLLDAYHALGRREEERALALTIMDRLDAPEAVVRAAARAPAEEGLAAYRAWQRQRLDPEGREPPGVASYLAQLHMQDGDVEHALRLLRAAARADPDRARLALLDPAFEPLRKDPRLPAALGVSTRP